MHDKNYYINKINKATDSIYDTWSSLNNQELEKLKESWDDPLCDEYISKFRKVDKLVSKMMSQLADIKACWEIYSKEEEKKEEEKRRDKQ